MKIHYINVYQARRVGRPAICAEAFAHLDLAIEDFENTDSTWYQWLYSLEVIDGKITRPLDMPTLLAEYEIDRRGEEDHRRWIASPEMTGRI